MFLYIYEDTFQGLLSAIYDAFYAREIPENIISQKEYQPSLTASEVWVLADEKKSDKVYDAVYKKISSRALKNIYYAYLSNEKSKGMLIYYYLKFGFRKGKKTDYCFTEPEVKPIYDLSQKVSLEKHRMEGLLRFQLLENGIYYAHIEPDHDIIELLAPHFSRRLSDQYWIIHDLSRDKAVLYNKMEWVSTFLYEKDIPALQEEEIKIQNIWRSYFKHISVTERKNPRLQRNFMPKRYWKHLIEIDE